MNKLKSLLLALFALSAITLVACEDSTTSPLDPDDDGQTEQTYQLKYVISNLYDLTDIATVTAYYIDEQGAEQSEVLTSSSWYYTIEELEAPFTASLYFRVERNNTELTKDSYQIGSGLGILYKLTSAEMWSGSTSTGSITIAADGVDAYLEKLNTNEPTTHTL